jgi:hypothetical protein
MIDVATLGCCGVGGRPLRLLGLSETASTANPEKRMIRFIVDI